MRTAVVSDLHLGSRSEADVLRDPRAQDALLRAIAGAERLVLLGDALELRHGPVAQALEAAHEVFPAIGEALGDGAEVVLVAGNHDHAIVAPWMERRAIARRPSLGLEHDSDAEDYEVAGVLARWLRPARTRLAYPGVWLRSDVYATHGHYLDRHVTVPTFERLAAGAMAKVIGEMPADRAVPDDYEAALAPLYAWLHVVSRHRPLGFERQKGTQNAWRLLTDSGPRPLRDRALVAAFPMAVRVLNLIGVGPIGPDLSPAELRRAGVRAMAETVRLLGIDARWVLF
ncbi:MAG TPA: metallophosphoesterase, partial [Solirubrobacteraceae bacterium]|nr:metallophosphoesterase [Solirubrobacteraceae bacterium]